MLLLAAVAVVNMTFAQSEVGKQINSIKRTGEYFFAESTLATEEEARESAMLMLMNRINDYMNENGTPEKKIKETDLGNAQSLKMKRGPMMRVFVYVKKSDFGASSDMAETKVEPIAPAPTPETSDTPSGSNIQQDILNESINDLMANGNNNNNNSSTVVPEAPNPVVPNVPARDSSEPAALTAWQQSAIMQLLEKTNLNDAAALLNRMQGEHIVKRFGTYKECKDVNGSYWILFDTDSSMTLITILGPGSDSRKNFKTRQQDSLKNYPGKNAVWFQFGK